jgi:hypothetical protein
MKLYQLLDQLNDLVVEHGDEMDAEIDLDGGFYPILKVRLVDGYNDEPFVAIKLEM